MWRYYKLCTDLSLKEIENLRRSVEGGRNPRDIKVELARKIVSDFYSAAEAEKSEEDFNLVFRGKQTPQEIEERTLKAGSWKLPRLLVESGLVTSMAEARRLIEQGGVSVDGEKNSSTNSEVSIEINQARVIQLGKRRFLRLRGE